MLIFAGIKCNNVKIKSYNAYKYHSAELEMTYIIDHLKAWGEWEEDE